MAHPVDTGIVDGKQLKVLKALIRQYGGDTNAILNALHEISARIAIATGVGPELFAQGMKHHWDTLANQINADLERGSPH